MKYLIIALLNLIYGGAVIMLINQNTPGYYLILSIALCLVLLGISGLVLYFIKIFAENNEIHEVHLQNWFSVSKNIDIVLILGIAFRIFVLQPFIVDGNSMEPSFHNSEYILVDQVSYRFYQPDHGDVIIFHPPNTANGTDYIKRIIGVPGDKIELKNDLVYLNGAILVENYTNPGTTKETDVTIFLGDDQYFVLGDNRDHSSDSRDFGAITKESMVGKAWLIVYPFNNFGVNKKPAETLKTPQASPSGAKL